jgi:hypothetical protein
MFASGSMFEPTPMYIVTDLSVIIAPWQYPAIRCRLPATETAAAAA